jgi:hypothetical protein
LYKRAKQNKYETIKKMKKILAAIIVFASIFAHAQDSKMNPKKMKGYSGETLTNAEHPILQKPPSINVYNDY